MAKQTILVVDDEKDLLDLIEYNLKKEGFNVLKAENGEEGIQVAKEHNPDLVLMDIMMPKMDGLEAVQKMRGDDDLKAIPIIFLTARSDEKTEVEGLDIGGDDYITKPISTTKLISRIKAVMRRFEETTEEVNRLEVHDLVIDKDRYIVLRGEEEFQLPRKEFELLYYL
ncbi:MAG TPA: DNA-binding response regulator, partial [Balneolaceae bacterium]|nr:DNA-binding response regulator [Balneolaceae bacterium]